MALESAQSATGKAVEKVCSVNLSAQSAAGQETVPYARAGAEPNQTTYF
jgi:hypothetical protein